jgi:hypothetical protein
MAKIVNLESYRSRVLAQKVFGAWNQRFQEEFHAETILSEISDKTLLFLARPGDESAFAFYEIIMGALDFGSASHFYYLDKGEQLMVVDVHLFMADQVRFELMWRLGWVEDYFCRTIPLLELIQSAQTLKSRARGNPPRLAADHPGYGEYHDLITPDKEAFVRRLLPQALEAFQAHFS